MDNFIILPSLLGVDNIEVPLLALALALWSRNPNSMFHGFYDLDWPNLSFKFEQLHEQFVHLLARSIMFGVYFFSVMIVERTR